MQLRLSTDYAKPSRAIRIAQYCGFTNNRNLYWSWGGSNPLNFGDWVGPLLFEAITGDVPLYCRTYDRLQKFSTTIFSAGSILGHISKPDRAIVWGSGIIFRNQTFERPKEILSVRGPISRTRCKELGFSCPDVFGDPAILLPRYLKHTKQGKKYAIGIIPHYMHLASIAKSIDSSPEIKLIDVLRPVQQVVDDIVLCDRTISSSLHGVIVSHAYGIPSTWIKFSAPLSGDDVKFVDYFNSVSLDAPVPQHLREDALDVPLIQHIAREAFLPDLSPLEEKLIRSCPFQSPSQGAQ